MIRIFTTYDGMREQAQVTVDVHFEFEDGLFTARYWSPRQGRLRELSRDYRMGDGEVAEWIRREEKAEYAWAGGKEY